MSSLRFIAVRFMWKATDRGHFSPMTLFSWIAISVGVAAMSCLLSVMYGFEAALKERVLRAYPHLIVHRSGGQVLRDTENIQKSMSLVEGVVRVFPFVETEMIVQSKLRTVGAIIRGLSEVDLQKAITFEMLNGNLPSLRERQPTIVLGNELATRLSAFIGDEIKVISPIETSGPLGMIPRAQFFKVSGIFTTGHYDFDHQYIFLLLEDAQDLLKIGTAITGWHIYGKNLFDSDQIAKNLTEVIPKELEVQSWSVFNAALFQSLKLEQYAMFVILSFAILIAVMNIVITLAMHVTHKRKNIGILMAMGASRSQIGRLFIWQGLFLGGIGLALGAVLAFGGLVYIRYFSKFQLPEIYYDRSIPIEIRPLALFLIFFVSVVLIYLSTLVPAIRASKLDPIEAIRE